MVEMNRAAAKEISFARFLSRREMLRFMGAGAAIGLMGCRRRKSRSPQVDLEQGQLSNAFAAAIPACVARPEQTEGPYFVDERLNRSDIRSEPSDNSVKPGVPLRLVFHVSR